MTAPAGPGDIVVVQRGMQRYPRSLRLIHWAIALLVAVQYSLIGLAHQLQSLEFGQAVFALHRQSGTLLFLLVIVRLAIAIRVRNPPSPFPRWQAMTARTVHAAMYVILIAQPTLGMLSTWSRGNSVELFGIIPVPALITLSSEQGLMLQAWHSRIAYTLLALIAVHLGAVVFNHVIRRKAVIERMFTDRRRHPVDPVLALTQLSLCLGLMVSLVLFAGGYAMRQYSAFAELSSQFDNNESTLLDEMRTAQLALVSSKRTAGDPRPLSETTASSQEAVEAIRTFPARLTDREAKAAADAAVRARNGADAEAQLQTAIDAQAMFLFEGRTQIAGTAAASHDMILLALAPTVFLSLFLAILMTGAILQPAIRRTDLADRRAQPTR
jgi:cytochrome b561